MSITAKIKDAERNADKWRGIVSRGTWAEKGKTEIQAIALREYFEGMLDGLTESKLLTKVRL